MLVVLAMFSTSAFADGLSGTANINLSKTEQFEADKKTASADTFNQNYYLRLDKAITSMLSYQVYLRSNLADSHAKDSDGLLKTTYQRIAEPAIDFFLNNPMYNINAGYRRQEQWSTAHFTDDSRTTSEFYYTRLDIKPQDLPSLSLQADTQNKHDYLTPNLADTVNNRYSASSAYAYNLKNITTLYNVTYTRNIDQTKTDIIPKSITDNFNGLYNLGYNRAFQEGKSSFSGSYQGNYLENRHQQFTSQTGSVLFKRLPIGGLYTQGTLFQPNADELSSEVSLVDNNFINGITRINLGTGKFHNIGIWVSPDKPVDRLFIYVNKDVSKDVNLTNPVNWKIFKSNSNLASGWSETTLQGVTVSAFDVLNNIFRYELVFLTPQSARFFKAVNFETVNAFGITDVLVTEIEAQGTDIVPTTGILVDEFTLYTQGLTLGANFKPLQKLNFSFNYFLNRSDQNPFSVPDSIYSLLRNLLSVNRGSRNAKPLTSVATGADKQGTPTELNQRNTITTQPLTNAEVKKRSNISKNYGANATWLAHRFLTTSLRVQRSENFDNLNEADSTSNIYALAFNSAPLPTLDTNFSIIRSDNFTFGKKDSTKDSYVLSLGSKLYKNVNMITDLEYSESQSFSSTPSTSTVALRGTIDALITRKLSGNVSYGISSSSSKGGSVAEQTSEQSAVPLSSTTKDSSLVLTYRPGRAINFSGSYKITESGGNVTSAQGVFVDWLPLPVIRLNLNYQHNRSEPGPSISDTFGGFSTWSITKFMDVQLLYSLNRNQKDKETTSYNLGLTFNLRF